MQFFASATAIFWQTHFVYAEKINENIKEDIDNSIARANIINSRFQLYGQFTPEEVIDLNQLTLRALYLMVQGLQNLRYFLRIGSQEAKGVDAALQIFDTGIWKKKEDKNAAAKVQATSG